MTEGPKVCSFPTSQDTKISYTCLQSEICCPVGCCLPPVRRANEFWYFWVVIGVCLFLLVCVHYYKKMKSEREARIARRDVRRRVVERPSNRYMMHHRRLESTTPVDDYFFQQLLISFRNRRNSIQADSLPPDYSTIEKEVICNDSLPDYSEACKMLEENNIQVPEIVVSPSQLEELVNEENLEVKHEEDQT